MSPDNLDELAVSLALQCEWKKAIEINNKILSIDPENIDALNRLARAYFETGNTKRAIEISKKVLSIESTNTIATRAIQKYKTAKTNSLKNQSINASDFIEEPGKTKTVLLINPGRESIISCLDSGDELMIQSHSHKVNVTTMDGKYIGRFPDDISAVVRRLIKDGAIFKVLIKSVDNHDVRVFVKCSKPLAKLKSQDDF